MYLESRYFLLNGWIDLLMSGKTPIEKELTAEDKAFCKLTVKNT